MSSVYDDIIDLPHHVSSTRPHMSAIDRAAQFSPFAALTGFGAAITETARLTDGKIELDDSEKSALNEKLSRIQEKLDSRAEVTVTYFKPDEKKSGGTYLTVKDAVKTIDKYGLNVVMMSGMKIPFDDIVEISGEPEAAEY